MKEVSLIVAAVLLGWALTGLAVRAFSGARHRVAPNERSMHTRPTPTGGGIGILVSVAMLWPLWRWPLTATEVSLVGLALLLGAVSWIDDYRQLWPATRLSIQAVAVAIALSMLPHDWRVVPALPIGVERLALGLAWVWLINLTNFMDGIDGIAASEVIAVAVGYVAVLTVAGRHSTWEPLALAMSGAAAGYLVWNWHPARIFMGDVGSIPLGFLMGWLMLDLASRGLIAAAIILPMYFICDATITLLRRIASGEKPWRAHRQHYYQRAVQGGARQSEVVLRIVMTNAALIVLALLSVRFPMPALGAAVAVTVVLLASLEHAAAGQTSSDTK